jgi:hypothetical protein
MTKDELLSMARKAGFPTAWISESGIVQWAQLERLVALARADEREACAKVCEDREEQWRKAGFFKDVHEFREMAFAIRARGETK